MIDVEVGEDGSGMALSKEAYPDGVGAEKKYCAQSPRIVLKWQLEF